MPETLDLTDAELDDALAAARETGAEATDPAYRAGYEQAAEFMHRYLREMHRLKQDPPEQPADHPFDLRE